MHSSTMPYPHLVRAPLFLIYLFVTPLPRRLPPALQTKALSSPTKTEKKKRNDNAVKTWKHANGDKIAKKKSEIKQYKNLDIVGGTES